MMNWTRTARLGLLLALCAARAAAGEKLEGRQAVASPDGSVIAVFPSGTQLRLVNAADGATRSETALPSRASELAFSPDGRKAAVALFGGGVLIVDAAGGSPASIEAGQTCSDLSWSPDGRRLRYVTRSAPPSPLIEGALDLKAWDAQQGTTRPWHRIQAERPAPSAAAAKTPQAPQVSPAPPQAPKPRRNEAGSGERKGPRKP